MDSDRHHCADQILEAIEYGQLSKEEIERRLNQIIDDELSAPVDTGYDAAKVELCNSLLWQLHTHGKIHLQSPSEKAKEKIKMDYSSHKRKVATIRHSIYAAASILIILVGLTALDVISPIQWFSRQSVNDEQQFFVEGHSINVDIIEEAIAEHKSTENTSFSTTDRTALVSFLGFDPGIPISISASFKAVQYDVLVMKRYIMITCQYGEDPSIVLFLTIYTDVDHALIQYEQDKEGESINLEGFQIYKYMNADRINYLWINDNAIYRLTSSTSSLLNDKLVQSLFVRRR